MSRRNRPEPGHVVPRMTLTRTRLAPLAVLALVAGLSGCTGNDGPSIASDPSVSVTPTAEPTVGTYPAYPYDDYTFTVSVGCFCPDAGQPIRITVVDGEATAAEWVREKGHQEGPVPDYWAKLTLATVIEATNDTEAAQVDVKWPSGQDYPDSVWVDRELNMADEEIGYTVTDVVPS
jgi:hypothetical protein